MAIIKFTSHLKRFYPDLKEERINRNNIKGLIEALNIKYVGISDYLIANDGGLREHVNVFVAGEVISDRLGLSDKVDDDDEVYIMQAISGG